MESGVEELPLPLRLSRAATASSAAFLHSAPAGTCPCPGQPCKCWILPSPFIIAASPAKQGADAEGRTPLELIREGQVVSGTVVAQLLYHGAQVRVLVCREVSCHSGQLTGGCPVACLQH